ncbi:homeobox protein aristaless-like 4 [Platysternon megacephalum]|uniref:Homeobox protein aristaless-like 4 n=1 Tax=Platysternon megacephalum TaxID=55544 RepID=A0A4D9EWJ2_9SAUR|nr:homeobox protein aristaless-like 4 [Platysternon megacephalum]
MKETLYILNFSMKGNGALAPGWSEWLAAPGPRTLEAWAPKELGAQTRQGSVRTFSKNRSGYKTARIKQSYVRNFLFTSSNQSSERFSGLEGMRYGFGTKKPGLQIQLGGLLGIYWGFLHFLPTLKSEASSCMYCKLLCRDHIYFCQAVQGS